MGLHPPFQLRIPSHQPASSKSQFLYTSLTPRRPPKIPRLERGGLLTPPFEALRPPSPATRLGFPPLRSRLLTGWRNGSPRSGKPLSSGSLAERAARSGRTEYAEGDGIAVVAKPVFWKGRLAKVIVVALPWEHRKALAPQHGAAPWPGSESSARRGRAPTSP